jgi:hypothetical protein
MVIRLDLAVACLRILWPHSKLTRHDYSFGDNVRKGDTQEMCSALLRHLEAPLVAAWSGIAWPLIK